MPSTVPVYRTFTSHVFIDQGIIPLREGYQKGPDPVWTGGGGSTGTSGLDVFSCFYYQLIEKAGDGRGTGKE